VHGGEGSVMTACQDLVPMLRETFTEAMARLVSGLAVITARRPDGQPCGLLVSSICSYSVRPPSILIAIDQASRSHLALITCTKFGAHLLGRDNASMARIFASQADDKFVGLDWEWDDVVPWLRGTQIYLSCATRNVFHEADHSIIVGEVLSGKIYSGAPLIYFRRRYNWQLRACA
jgi:flavin reductase (DIM6/NTAB) family NADH-FMN oxidoreductase RutF